MLIQISTDVLWVLIWVQTVCEGYQHRQNLPLAGKELFMLRGVKKNHFFDVALLDTHSICFVCELKCGSRGGDRGSGPPPWKITSYMGLNSE